MVEPAESIHVQVVVFFKLSSKKSFEHTTSSLKNKVEFDNLMQ